MVPDQAAVDLGTVPVMADVTAAARLVPALADPAVPVAPAVATARVVLADQAAHQAHAVVQVGRAIMVAPVPAVQVDQAAHRARAVVLAAAASADREIAVLLPALVVVGRQQQRLPVASVAAAIPPIP